MRGTEIRIRLSLTLGFSGNWNVNVTYHAAPASTAHDKGRATSQGCWNYTGADLSAIAALPMPHGKTLPLLR